jgi:hypothetical protein
MEKELIINGREYRIRQYRVRQRIKFHLILTKMAGNGAKIADGLLDGYVDNSINLDSIGLGSSIENILGKIDPDKNMEFILSTIKDLTVSPKKATIDATDNEFDKYFSENFVDVYPLFMECIEHNITDSISEHLKKKLLAYVNNIFDFMGAEPESSSTPDLEK